MKVKLSQMETLKVLLEQLIKVELPSQESFRLTDFIIGVFNPKFQAYSAQRDKINDALCEKKENPDGSGTFPVLDKNGDYTIPKENQAEWEKQMIDLHNVDLELDFTIPRAAFMGTRIRPELMMALKEVGLLAA